jgi:tetratricopeptide (TPR) repeat protein
VDRRDFLALSGSVAGTFLLSGAPGALDGLHRRAQAGAARARTQPPAVTSAEATDLLMLAEVAALAPGSLQRRSLHRTAALTALTAAAACRRARRPAAGIIARAREHAEAAGDGPLEAQALMSQRDEDGAAVGAGSAGSVKLLSAALVYAGCTRDASSLRAAIFYRLAAERAALGDAHGALQELEGADASVEMALVSPDFAEDTDLRTGGAAALRGEALRLAGLHGEAEQALTTALATRLHPAGSHVSLARLHAAAGDVDRAVAHLEQALLVARVAGSTRPIALVRTIAATLPATPSVRQLWELLRD